MSSSNSASSSSSSKSGGTSVMPVQTAPMDGTSPRDAAINYRNQQIASQSQMNKQYSGGKKRKYRGGSTPVPQFSVPGPPVGAGGQNPNGASVSANTALTQGGANAACDKCIGPASASAICQGPQCNPNAPPMKGGCASCGGVMPVSYTHLTLPTICSV